MKRKMAFEWLRFWKRTSLKKETFNELQELKEAASVISNQKLNGKHRIEFGIAHLMAAKIHEKMLKRLLEEAEKEETAHQERANALLEEAKKGETPTISYYTLTDSQKRLMDDMHNLTRDLNAIGTTITGDEKRIRVDIGNWIELLQLAKRNIDRKGNIGGGWDKT